MDVRKAALKSLIKILEKHSPADETIKHYSDKILIPSELSGLVSGTVKNVLTLDYFIQKISVRKIHDLSYQVKNALRLAVYELEYLKTPDYAVINSYVELTKQYDKKSASFVNGILRNFIRKRGLIHFPDIKEDPVYAVSVKYSHPEWLVSKWIKEYGLENTIEICKFDNLAPKLVIRVNTNKISKIDLMEFFKEKEVSFSDDRIIDECLILNQKGNVTEIPGFSKGYWIVQSESSSLASIVLDPKENETILDLCAAPGGKTTHIAALMKDKGKITAVDINPKRLEKVKDNCKRLGISSVSIETADATKYASDIKFDRILIDAPCSNTGVLGKRIDARWNRTPEDINNLARLQQQILNNAAKLLKSGGILVYSTCSIEKEENRLNVEEFLNTNNDFQLDKIEPYIPWTLEEDKGYIQILQSIHHIDGFFIARLKKL